MGDILGKNQLQLAENHNPLGEKYRVQRHAGCRTVSGEITKVVSDAQGKPLDRCTEKNTGSSVMLVNEKLTFAAYDRIGGVGARATRVVDFCLVRFVRFLGKVGVRANFRFHATAQKLCSARGFFDIARKLHAVCGFCDIARKFRAAHFGFHITALFQKFPLRVANRGAILIEFAICMPILIILLFYINDLVRIKRYYSQTEFVGQQMANILQNISQKRENTRIYLNDIRYAASLAFLSMYPGKTMYHTDTRSSQSHELSHSPEFFVYYVKGLAGGKASCIWHHYIWCSTGTVPMGWSVSSNTKSDHSQSVVRFRTEAEPSSIYPTLKINEGEVKIIVEATPWCRLVIMSTSDYNASDDQSTCARKAFRCRLVTPKVVGSANYFNSVVIFTPKPGLFDETAPS